MNIELWTWKFSGINKDTFTFWKTVRSEIIPNMGRTFIYTTKSNVSIKFTVDHIEYETKFSVVIPQICLKKVTKN